MKGNITFKSIWDLIKANIGTVIVVGSLTLTGITMIQKKAVTKANEQNSNANQNIRIDKWITYDSIEHVESKLFRTSVTNNIRAITDSVTTTNKNVRRFSKVLLNLKDYMIDSAATKNQVLRIQDVFDVEKKNYENYLYRIPPDTTRSDMDFSMNDSGQ
jgi:hypothetical protein